MAALKYEEIGPVSHDEAEANLVSGNLKVMSRTLIALGLHDDDWKWVQTEAMKFLRHDSEVVVSAAILALAHTARVNGVIDKDLVVPALRAIAADKRYTGEVQDALDDFEMFVRP